MGGILFHHRPDRIGGKSVSNWERQKDAEIVQK
jgi:hypothetical protein